MTAQPSITPQPLANSTTCDVELASQSSSLTLSMLPPMPMPDYAQKHAEQWRGVQLVLWIIAWCVGLTHGVGLTVGRVPLPFWWVALVVIYTLAALALASLTGLLVGDPGVVCRSEENCFPLPDEVMRRIKAGQPVYEGLNNIVDGDRSFCVRCLPGARAHPAQPA